MITRKRVFDILNSLGADSKTYVAGSAAIMPELAADVDIWLLRKSCLQEATFDPTIWTDKGLSPYNGIPVVTKRLETIAPGLEGHQEPVKIQIMFTNAKSMESVLYYFDASCHAWARNNNGFLLAHPKATVPGSPIVNLRPLEVELLGEGCPDPECNCQDGIKEEIALAHNTLARIAKFTARYAGTTASMCWLPS